MTSEPSPDPRLSELARANRRLLRRARATACGCPSAVLNLGTSVATLATYAGCAAELNRFLDDSVLEELMAERRRLAADLELLEHLAREADDSPDVESLSRALLERIRGLVEHEDRVLYQPLLRLAVGAGSERTEPERRCP